MASHDAIIIGGGPAGSTCARVLTRAGLRVAIVDRARFPRVKLCAGWLSPAIWDALEMSARDYPHGLWEWHTCHVHYRGTSHAVPCHGWFIRRYELDDFLMKRSGAELVEMQVKQIDRVGDEWSVGALSARYLVGAGGTNCPVARMLAPPRPRRALGVQELELEADPHGIAETRAGNDGEPELVLFDDFGGYGWNVPKSDWLNVGCGALDATEVHDRWRTTNQHLRTCGHLPPGLDLAHMKGHSYYLFDPIHLASAQRDGALLVGDSLGLAHPITGEGILPAVVSGRIAAAAILAGDPAGYPARLRADPILADYGRAHRIVRLLRKLRRAGNGDSSRHGNGDTRHGNGDTSRPRRLAERAIARGFTWMFSGARLPAPRLFDLVLGKEM